MKWRVLAVIVTITGCDNSEALHEPHPSLERMQTQERVNPFDERGMRLPPDDTVAQEQNGAPTNVDDAGGIPIAVDQALLYEGQASFNRVCATCHGILGDGNSVVASKMQERPPPSLHDARSLALTRQDLFDIIGSGYGLMPGYAHMLDARERWSVIAYLDALRLSRHAVVADLPLDAQQELRQEIAK